MPSSTAEEVIPACEQAPDLGARLGRRRRTRTATFSPLWWSGCKLMMSGSWCGLTEASTLQIILPPLAPKFANFPSEPGSESNVLSKETRFSLLGDERLVNGSASSFFCQARFSFVRASMPDMAPCQTHGSGQKSLARKPGVWLEVVSASCCR